MEAPHAHYLAGRCNVFLSSLEDPPKIMVQGTDWNWVRGLFPAAQASVYVNAASYTPAAAPVLAAVQEGLSAWSSGAGDWREWEDRAEESRGLFARLIGGAATDVALLSSLSAAAGQVAACLPNPAQGERPNLVVGADEFRSNLFPWLSQERRGYEIRMVPFRAGRLLAEDVCAAMDERTELVAVSHVQSANGYRIDLERLAEVCSRSPARLFVDATQSIGGLRVPLDGVDFLAAAAYKWLLSPRGAAFLYVSARRLPELHPIQPSWKTAAEPYGDYYGLPFEPPERASRLDVSLAWPVWQGTTRALELLLDVGLEEIEDHNLALARLFSEGLERIGLQPLFEGGECSPIVALRVEEPEALRERLARAGVVAAVRAEYLRTAFHLYNNEEDVERVLEVLGS